MRRFACRRLHDLRAALRPSIVGRQSAGCGQESPTQKKPPGLKLGGFHVPRCSSATAADSIGVQPIDG
jgi:hypothetical protein